MRLRIRLVAITAALGVTVLAFASLQAPALGASTPHFLTLPFAAGQRIVIQRAWITRGSTGAFNLLHHAVDYVFGIRDVIPTWKNFNVLAAAPGEACGAKFGQTGCFDDGEKMGNRVLIKHNVDGVTYYTFYNHLKTIAGGIPLNNVHNTVHVNAGQLIGVAGDSNSAGEIHLHFELLDAKMKPLDPYGIYGITDQYPDPKGKNGKLSAAKNYFINNPPTAFGAKPKPTPSPPASTGPVASVSPSAVPGESVAPASPEPVASAPGAAASPGSGSSGSPPSPSPSPNPLGAPVAPAEGGMGLVPVAVGIGALVAAAVLLGLVLLSRRRRQALGRDGNWKP